MLFNLAQALGLLLAIAGVAQMPRARVPRAVVWLISATAVGASVYVIGIAIGQSEPVGFTYGLLLGGSALTFAFSGGRRARIVAWAAMFLMLAVIPTALTLGLPLIGFLAFDAFRRAPATAGTVPDGLPPS